MVRIQIFTDDRRDAGRFFTFGTNTLIFAFHPVHIGGRTSQITQVSFEIWHFRDSLYFFQDRLFAPGSDELSLVGGDCTECTATKASPVHIY